MAKTIAKTPSKPGAWIVSPKDKGRKSIKSGKVFLNDEEYFEIEIFNPLTVSVLADIKLNSESISKTGLVIKPGQRIYLDCFIDDRKKFKFSTYQVENSEESIEAIQKNGLLEVFFYKEDVIIMDNWKSKFDKIIIEKWYQPYYYPVYPTYPTYPNYPKIWYGTTIGTGGTGVINTNGSSTTTNSYYSNNCSYTSNIDLSNLNVSSSISSNMNLIDSIETGRVEKGEKSSQKFTEVDIAFENSYISSTIIQILPESRKPVDTKEIFNKKSGEIKFKSGSSQIIELIKKLSDLHKTGILTDSEFSEKKSELLNKI
jgi:hypothetical protein